MSPKITLVVDDMRVEIADDTLEISYLDKSSSIRLTMANAKIMVKFFTDNVNVPGVNDGANT